MEGKNPMAWNNPGYDGETTSLLPSFTYFLLASNGIGAIYRAQASGNYSTVVFIFFILFGFLLLEYCLSAYQRLPPHQKSRTKDFWKFSIWFVFTVIMFGFAYQFAPFFGLPGLLLYAISIIGSAFLFFVWIIVDNGSGCPECCSYEKRKFSDSSSPDEKADNKKIKHSDSILEMV